MRPLLLTALLAAAACAPQGGPPIEVTTVPASQIPPVPGNAAQQTERRLNRELGQGGNPGRDPYAASMAGTPTPSTDEEIGGGDPGIGVPQIGIPFQ